MKPFIRNFKCPTAAKYIKTWFPYNSDVKTAFQPFILFHAENDNNNVMLKFGFKICSGLVLVIAIINTFLVVKIVKYPPPRPQCNQQMTTSGKLKEREKIRKREKVKTMGKVKNKSAKWRNRELKMAVL
jgi:hypothetical protein